MAANRSFRVYRDGADMGVFSGQQLQEFARAGTLVASDEIEEVGSNQRCRADQLRGLGFVGAIESSAALAAGGRRRVSAPPPARVVPVYQAPVATAGTGFPATAGSDPFAFGAGPGTGPSAGETVTRVGSRASSKKTMIIVAAAVGGVLLLAGVGLAVFLLMPDQYVQLVKNDRLVGCPHRTVGDMTNDFLSRPRWKSFKGASGKRYVTCTGGAEFLGDPVTAKLTFIFTGKNRFRLDTIEIDDEELPPILEIGFIGKMCES